MDADDIFIQGFGTKKKLPLRKYAIHFDFILVNTPHFSSPELCAEL
jgi:hypothetical protein